MNTKILIIWFALLLSIPATYYAVVSAVLYSWISAVEPERWSALKVSVWVGGSLVLALAFFSLFIYCILSLIKIANRADNKHNQ